MPSTAVVASLLLARCSLDDIRITCNHTIIRIINLVKCMQGTRCIFWKVTVLKLPGSIMLRQQTRKYLPQAVPRSTLSRKPNNKSWLHSEQCHRQSEIHNPISNHYIGSDMHIFGYSDSWSKETGNNNRKCELSSLLGNSLDNYINVNQDLTDTLACRSQSTED